MTISSVGTESKARARNERDETLSTHNFPRSIQEIATGAIHGASKDSINGVPAMIGYYKSSATANQGMRMHPGEPMKEQDAATIKGIIAII